MGMNRAARWLAPLGLVSLVGLLLATLALIDIGQGIEPDLSLEWSVVRAAFVVAAVFHVLALAVLVPSVRRRERAN